MEKLNRKLALLSSVFLFLLIISAPTLIFADQTFSSNCKTGQLCNPIGASDINQLLRNILDVAVKIGIPIAVLFIMWAGFKFVTASGDETALKSAKSMFWWTIIGTAVLLGAKILAEVLKTTVDQITK